MKLLRYLLVCLAFVVAAILVPRATYAQCPAFPKVKLWGKISHETVIRYVRTRMNGDWGAYIDRLKNIRNQLQAIHDQQKPARIRSGNQRITLTGAKLRTYLKLSDKRIAIVTCLSKQAPGEDAGTATRVAGDREKKESEKSADQMARRNIKGRPSAGLGLSVLCVDCHGESGASNDPLTPILAGQKAAYVARQLTFMRNSARDRAGYNSFDDEKRRAVSRKFGSLLRNERTAEFMDEAVIDLNDQQIRDLAAYYATQPCAQSIPVSSMAVPPLVSTSCAACHGENGIARLANVPNIAGQHHDYLRDQLIAFKLAGLEAKTGTKDIPRNKSMALQVADLRITDIEELATYFSRLPCR